VSSPNAGALAPLDEARLREALALAEGAIGLSDPNPRVGCVLADKTGERLARGHTQQAGGAHAEVMALRDAATKALDLRGGTAWVSLEPCAHHGRTPPCCDALIAASLKRVVVAVQDPFPGVNGAGIERLRAAGIEVVVANGALAQAAREINIGFFSRLERGRPWVRLKSAVTLDGRTALPDGRSQWITSEAARRDGHAWRRRAGAVLTGIGTVLADDPRLDVRGVPTQRQPLRVVLDSRLRLPAQARIVQPPGQVLVVHAQADSERPAWAAAAPQADWWACRAPTSGQAHVDLAALLPELARRGVNELHVEAGARLGGALLDAGLVDELLVYVAPKLFGQGPGLATITPLPDVASAPAWAFHGVEPVGPDLRLLLRWPAAQQVWAGAPT
jgi:diaminohydroxyphosphoribosylaminopyrimidine deaminase/5-amino-6-(5-phosphoribosylamino)uracil reductase